jgi:hypothetical protein
MSLAKSTGVCPYCKEQINSAATKCKHCQSDLSDYRKKKPPFLARFNTFKFGFIAGVGFAVVLGVLVYLEFFSD